MKTLNTILTDKISEFVINLDGRRSEVKFLEKNGFSKEFLKNANKKHQDRLRERIQDTRNSKFSIKEAYDVIKMFGGNSNYSKRLIQGNKNIYLASPIYGHSDYNKSIFCENTPKNWEKCVLINKIMDK